MRLGILYTIIVAALVWPAWGRDPEVLDRSQRFKDAIGKVRDALAPANQDDDQRANLETAISTLKQFSKDYPDFQVDTIAVRLDACRTMLASLSPPDGPEAGTPHTPSKLAMSYQLQRLLDENIRLRDKLKATENDDGSSVALSEDLKHALKTVVTLKKQVDDVNDAMESLVAKHAKEVDYLNAELKKLSRTNLELNGDVARQSKAIAELTNKLNTAETTTFTKEDDLRKLKAETTRLETVVAKLKAENGQAAEIIAGLKVGNAEALKKRYSDARATLLKQATLMAEERQKATAVKRQMIDTQKALDILQIQNAKLRETLKLYKQGSDHVIITELENTVATYKKKLAATTKANDRLKQQLTAWKSINKELMQALKGDSNTQGAETQERLRAQVAAQTVVIAELQASVRDKAAEVETLRTQVEELKAASVLATPPESSSKTPLTDEQKQEVQLLLQQAKAGIVAKNFDRAREFTESALKLDSSNPTAKLYLADMSLRQKNYVEALKWVAELKPGPEALAVQAAVHKATNNTDIFLAQLFTTIAENPENSEVRLISIRHLRRIKQYDMAEHQLETLLKLVPDSFDGAKEYYFLYVAKGSNYINQQKTWYNKALALDPSRRNELKIDE